MGRESMGASARAGEPETAGPETYRERSECDEGTATMLSRPTPCRRDVAMLEEGRRHETVDGGESGTQGSDNLAINKPHSTGGRVLRATSNDFDEYCTGMHDRNTKAQEWPTSRENTATLAASAMF
mmetsp:Transcript_39289/g.80491  ORF Transcript_39289/g.80491 Transcript_39289/m.80491 type:complete len:126 (-) Transcript_39289:1099-1476(-)